MKTYTNKLLKLLYVFIFAFFALGFSSSFNIIVEPNGQQTLFKLEKLNPITRIQTNVELTSFMVVEKKVGDWDYSNPLWAFELKPGTSLEVKQFNYGEVPNGFMETAKPRKLLSGGAYMAVAFGPGMGSSSEFIKR